MLRRNRLRSKRGQIFMVHPVLNTFHSRYESDFTHRNAWTGNTTLLEDSLNNRYIRLTPASAMDATHIECSLVFKSPNELFYKAPYKFVRGTQEKYKFENPTIIGLAKDAKVVGEFIEFEIRICKEKNEKLKSEDKDQKTVFQVERFPCGTRVNFDDEFSSLKEKKNKPLTPNRLAKLVDLYTAYIVIRRARWDANKEEFVPEPEILCCSNAFKPENSSVKTAQYDYTPNQLKINEINFSPDTTSPNTHQFNLWLSFVIPPLYECTGLKNKCLQATIITTRKANSQTYPIFKFITDQGPAEFIFIPATQYESRILLKIIKITLGSIYQDLPVSYADRSVVVVSPMQKTMESFCVELQLCDYSTGNTIPYPHSTVKHVQMVDDLNSSKEPTHPSSLSDSDSVDECIDPSSSNSKRSFEKEINERSDSPTLKCQKHEQFGLTFS